MELALFQLENLLLTRTRFCFLDLRTQRAEDQDRKLEFILKNATPLPAADVEKHLRSLQLAKDQPVIMICENGKVSLAVAARLEALGFTNAYVVAGGIAGLLAEL
jgi:rhodanese-related sulfurtransferase